MKIWKVKVGGQVYECAAENAEMAEALVRLKFKIDGRRKAWVRSVRGYKFK